MSDLHLPPDHLDEDDDWGLSKSQLKREAHAAQHLGEILAELDAGTLDQLPLTERLREALKKLQLMHSHGARKRQRQYIGKLMRAEDVEAIEAGLRQIDPNSPENQRLQMQTEAWRDALIQETDAITRFVDDFPGVDVQHFRQLQRGARAEAEREEHGSATQALFQAIRAEIRANTQAQSQANTPAADDMNESQGSNAE